ncbi:porin [Paraburkholderia fungorum]|uniref:Porin n=1 Tax=Paraburkholderia fungorum TaxID=134537 RepID=A0A3R7E2F6_9BURK|nr:porin [Paraburkholderia fungorum]RKF33372.1 porin [Paraburkholderia fungorum]
MKKTILAATATLAGIVAPGISSAQSSVTLYGLIDVGVNYLSNAQTGRSGNQLVGRSQYSLQEGSTGGQNGSRWGLRGTEDLGGGLSAIFQIENGFAINNGTLGQGGAEFGRQAYVGLQSSYGTVTLGRQYDPVVSFVQPFAAGAQWGGYISSHPDDVDNLLNTRRINNSVKYMSRSYGGFNFGGLYSLGGVPGSVGRNQIWSLGAGYTAGSLALGVGYLNARNPNFSYFGTNPSAGTALTSNNMGALGSATSAQSNPVVAGYASASTTQVIAAGASYVIGSATLGATYSNTQFRGLGNTGSSGPNPFGYSGTATFNNAEANFKYQISLALLAGGAYDYTRSSGASGRAGATYQQASVGTDYFLSKRTDVYAIVVYQHASGTDSLNQPAVASITGQTASANNHEVLVRLGLRHKF